jgi:DNA-binding Xre family transcriptional regulator
MAKSVSIDTLLRISEFLDYDIADIVEAVTVKGNK